MPRDDKREWLAKLFRDAVAAAEKDIPDRPQQGRAAFVVGWVLGHARMSESEQDQVMEVVS